MNMITSSILVGIMIVLAFVIFSVMKRARGGNEYDERQEAIQGRAFKMAYYFNIIGILLIAAFEEEITGVMELSVAIFVWVFVSGLILIARQMFQDAYFGRNMQKGQLLVCYVVLAVSQIVTGVTRASEGKLYENGIISLGGAIPFITGGFFIVFLMINLAKKIVDRSGVDE